MNTSYDSLWLAIRLPHFYLEAMGVSFDTQENIVVSHKNNLWDFSKPLAASPIALGSPISTTQLLINAKQIELELDAVNDLSQKLLYLLYQFTPYIEPYHIKHPCGVIIRGFYLELSKCLILFKGLCNLINAIKDTLNKSALSYSIGLAHTQQAAWVLSYAQSNIPTVFDKKRCVEELNTLPIDLMHEYKQQIASLKAMGFIHFSDINTQIQNNGLKSFRKRFDNEFCDCLDEIFNLSNNNTKQISLFKKPKKVFFPEIHFQEEIQFDFPINSTEQLVNPITQLLEQLAHFLKKNQQQTQSIKIQLADIYQNKKTIVVAFDRFYQDWQLPLELSMIQLENQDLPFEIDTLTLYCPKTTSLDQSQKTLNIENKTTANHSEFLLTTARIVARIGQENIFKYACFDSHVPEYAISKMGFDQEIKCEQRHLTSSIRPTWLLSTPAPAKQLTSDELYWHGLLCVIQGPERIQSHWWETNIVRDYFVARRNDGVRLWIFKDLTEESWFVHGVFS